MGDLKLLAESALASSAAGCTEAEGAGWGAIGGDTECVTTVPAPGLPILSLRSWVSISSSVRSDFCIKEMIPLSSLKSKVYFLHLIVMKNDYI